MASPQLDYETDKQADERLNPGEREFYNAAKSDMGGEERNTSKKLADRERDLAPSQDKNAKQDESLGDRESQTEGLYDREPSQKKQAKAKTSTKKKAAALLGVGAIGGGIIGMVLFLLPLKLTAMIETIVGKIGAIPEYAIEQRMEYITTRWLAQRVLKEAYGGDADLVFCKGGGVLCSIGATKYSKWFENKLDATFEKTGNGKVRVVIDAKGRQGLGGKATSFDIHLESNDPDSAMRGVKKNISHKEMRKRIKHMTRQVHGRNFFMRYLSGRMLRAKYGVKAFNIIPEKTARKFSEFKANIKSGAITRLSRRVSPRMGAYMACISGSSAIGCQETLDKLNKSIDDDIKRAKDNLENKQSGTEDHRKAQNKLDAAKSKKDLMAGATDVIDGKADTALSKIISKNIVKKVAAGAGAIGMIDMVAGAVGAINDKTIEVMAKDQVAMTYVSFAFDEGISPIIVNDQMKAGDLKDMQYLQLATEMFDGAEQSPLFQAAHFTNPVVSAFMPTVVSANGSVTSMCDNGEGKEVPTILKPGELVCPERKIVQEYTAFTNTWWWGMAAGMADVWNSTIGKIINVVGDWVGAGFSWIFENIISEIPGVSSAVEWTGEKMTALFSTILSYIFRIPDVGIGAPGAHNYEALAGGLMTSMNGSLEAGQDPENMSTPPLGIGGTILTDDQIAAISSEAEREDLEDFNTQPLLAKLFDPTLRRSAVSQIAPLLPTSRIAGLQLLLRTPGSLLGSLNAPRANAAADNTAFLKSMGMPWYGYTDPSVFEADPATYTPEFCKASAQKRKDSYSRVDGEEIIPTFKQADPCALEKTIAGILAHEAGDTESEHYIRSGNGSSSSTSVGAIGAPELTEAQSEPWGGHSNGRIPDSALGALTTAAGHKMHPNAAQAFDKMNNDYKSKFGTFMTVNESYRTYETQVQYKNNPELMAAVPGTSNHGLGLAVDINVGGYNSDTYKWLTENAAKYGFVNPPWALQGKGREEPWHWEYARRVK